MDLMGLAALETAVDEARRAGIDKDPRGVMRWARDLLGEGLMMTTSFQKGGMVLLHMVREAVPGLPVFFLDTGFHFPETLEFAERIGKEWGLNLILRTGKLHGPPFEAKYGKLHETNPDLCCHLNKVEPQAEILKEYQGWITSIRRDQASTRAQAEILEILEGAKLKVQPLAGWSREQLGAYINENHIPIHPLYSQGYTSIGCGPCTQPSSDPLNERAGRWGGKKVECGLHTFWQSRGGAPAEAAAPPPAQVINGAPEPTREPAPLPSVPPGPAIHPAPDAPAAVS